MPEPQPDEFYVGYLDTAPAGIARRVRQAVIGVLSTVVVLAVALPAAQARFTPSVFEFGNVRELVGWIETKPHPRLLVPTPGAGPGGHHFSSYSLVGFGKHGADAEVAGLDGVQVRLQGTLVYVEDQTMVELVAGSVERIGASASAAPGAEREALGRHTLVGEIVDSKCYFGVMNPGTGKVHRACATRCISGGVPPILLVADRDGGMSHLLLVGADGRSVNAEVLDLIAEPVRISGDVFRHGNLLVLQADPKTYTRIP